MHIQLYPVYSKIADPANVQEVLRGRKLPEGLVLRLHQAQTLAALEDPDVDVVLNTAMTGDGKSLAAYLRVLIGPSASSGEDSLGTLMSMYPTNELVKDQIRQFEHYQQLFQQRIQYQDIWGAKLTELANGGNRATELIAQLKQNWVILTNPDMFTAMMNYRYRSPSFSLQEIPATLMDFYGYFLFDEWHLFVIPQYASALTAMMYGRTWKTGRFPPKAIFASATQNPLLTNLLQRAGISSRTIKGEYRQDDPGDQTYIRILEPVALTFHQLQEQETIEDWICGHIEIIESAWQEEKSGRVAIIVTSVAAARRIANFLRSALRKSTIKTDGLRVEEITGLHRGSVLGDVVVGTSTIDVGVDFAINLLIFEGANAGQFLQRLGRLGRNNTFQAGMGSCSAYCILSAKTPWIGERIKASLEQRGVQEGEYIDRPSTLREIIEEAYPTETNFAPYLARWAGLQGYDILHTIRNRLREYGDGVSAYRSFADMFEPALAKLYLRGQKDLGIIRRRYYALIKRDDDGYRMRQVLEDVLAFRGSSPFQVAIMDATLHDGDPEQTFKVYDLFFVIAATQWELMSYERYMDARQKSCASATQWQSEQLRLEHETRFTLQDHEQPLCLKITDYLPERERLLLSLILKGDYEVVPEEHIEVLRGFRIADPRLNPALDALNKVLSKQQVTTFITRHTMNEIRRWQVPALFPLYALQIPRNGEYTVTFGKQALMLESLARTRRLRRQHSDSGPIIL